MGVRANVRRVNVRRDLDKLLVLGSVQMNLHCSLLFAVLQSRRSEYQDFKSEKAH